MENIKKLYHYIKERYILVSRKKYTTFAGTLVFFFLMSIIPMSYLATLFFGSLKIDYTKIFDLEIFETFEEFINSVNEIAKNANSGSSIFFAITAIYSSGNFFYHVRRIGEITYEYKKQNKGLKVRIGAILLVFVLFILGLIGGGIFFFLQAFIESLFTSIFAKLIVTLIIILIAFMIDVLLNIYVCPYKLKIKELLFGSVVTIIYWLVASIGFTIYLQYFSNIQKTYGALAFIMIFLLWLYIVMQGFLIGVILNAHRNKKIK